MSTQFAALPLSFDACYRAASGRDRRWDGRFYLGVTSTGIYCRPSCPARKPKPANCRFFPSAAACVAAGFRACKRCRPDALPGSRDWDHRSDLVARAVRGIRDGAIDVGGVTGLASSLAVSERHLRRILLDEIGATPIQLARTRRAHAARILIEQTDLSLTDVAFAAGFGSVRQFGDTMRDEFGMAPSAIARRAGQDAPAAGATGDGGDDDDGRPGPESREWPTVTLRLQTRAPFDAQATRSFLAAHAIPGRDMIGAGTADLPSATAPTSHAIDVPGGTARATISWADVPAVAEQLPGTLGIPVMLALPSLADTMPAIQIVRRMLDLDADPAQLADAFAGDPILGPLVAARPGLRLPGARDPHEFALATVLGQQVSLAAARTLQGRLVAEFAEPGGHAELGFSGRVDVSRIAAETPESLQSTLRITGARAATLRGLAGALERGLDIGQGADRERARAELIALRGIGPWTVELIAMRALGDPDAYPAGDLILRRALGVAGAKAAEAAAEAWRPFRGYATQYLWADFLAHAAAGGASPATSNPPKDTKDTP
ncbi:putative bifunctional transcriptional activator/DNA repair enzyme AlkA [Leucobacter aridicollis]|uniref:DNA-3-methyladenine glycosylase 2 family protein n=1 Tax=Leucobacter aridicollis TaxID=283878 RepID=UPI0037C79E65